MPDMQSFADRLHYDGTRGYTKTQGNIAYLDGSPLARPANMPRTQRLIALVIILVAILIGFVLVNKFVIARWQEAADTEQAIASNIAAEASIDTIPAVATLIPLDNAAIKATLTDAGYTVYDVSEKDDSNDLALYKLPTGMAVEEAAVLYSQGTGSLDAVQASRLLAGSWYLAADRVSGTSIVVRYTDFTTADPQIAVQNAIRKEGFDATTITDSGVDESNNTYSTGTLDANGTPCTWKVSALPLSEMYSISGLPENACYVGVRVTAQ